MDRIDIHVEVPSVRYQELSALEPGESSDDIRARVITARKLQQERFKKLRNVHCNADMRPKDLPRCCILTSDAQNHLKMAMAEYDLSARAYDRILKVSRTIADLAGGIEKIESDHISEAIQYRSLDRELWV